MSEAMKDEYRFWDKTTQTMIYPNDVETDNSQKEWPFLLALGLHGLPISVDKDSFKKGSIVGWNVDHNMIPMRCLGRKDRKGNKVWDGDIVARFNTKHPESGGDFKIGAEMYRGPIQYDPETTSYRITCGLWFEIQRDHDIEVIGNLYQNPELRPQ